MKLPIEWVREYVAVPGDVDELAHRLTMAGLEIEDVERVDPIPGIIVAQVIHCEKHPNSDHLSICKVNTGTAEIPIVCGAPNVRTGIKVALATLGTRIGDMEIRKAKIRGAVSEGMLCSERELGLSEDHAGILILPESYEVGRDFYSQFPVPDPVLTVAITPNRGDCLSMFGLARDIGALYRTPMKIPQVSLKDDGSASAEKIRISLHNPEHCPRYVGRYLSNVRIGPSPDWMVRRLKQAGMRSINNVVDITNYVMLETGQPLHAFDYKKIEKSEINVRLAKEGESFTTLDGKDHKLSAKHLLICDGVRPVALAGIMGGACSEVDDSTTEILLESAHFNSVTIRIGAKLLGISTEASYRFERGVDPQGCLYAADRTAELMVRYAGAQIAGKAVDAYPNPVQPVHITLRQARINGTLGIDVPSHEVESVLSSLCMPFTPMVNAAWNVTAPTFRPDVEREADLIEEVARVYGYDKIPAKTKAQISFTAGPSRDARITDELRRMLAGLGFCEAYCNSISEEQEQLLFAPSLKAESLVRLVNPLSPELAILRASMIPGLVRVAQWNRNRKIDDLQIFEMGRAFRSQGKDTLPIETSLIAGLIMGRRFPRDWYGDMAHDFGSAKGLLSSLLERCRVVELRYEALTEAPFLSGESARILSGNEYFGFLGTLSPAICDRYDLRAPVFVFEIRQDILSAACAAPRVFQPLPKFPPIDRDFAFVFDVNTPAETVRVHIKRLSPLIEQVEWFDFYAGKQIAAGKKSMALTVRMRSSERTLTDVDAEEVSRIVVESVAKTFNGELRK